MPGRCERVRSILSPRQRVHGGLRRGARPQQLRSDDWLARGGGTVTLGSAALTAGGDSTTFAGGLGGTGGSLVKTGTGTLLLTATSLYSGATTVSAGTLVVNGDIASSSGITVNAGARLAGTGTVGATLINSGGMFGPGLDARQQDDGGGQSGVPVGRALPGAGRSLERLARQRHRGGSATLAGTAVAAFAPAATSRAATPHPFRHRRPRRQHIRCAHHKQSAGRLHRPSRLHQ